MIRLFLPPEQLKSEKIVITGDQAKHLSVLRVWPGEMIRVFDGRGYTYDCTVEQVHKKEVKARLQKKTRCSVESPLSITLAQGLPKGNKMDLIVQKATELGVKTIVPLITERSQVRHTHKIERWRKITASASQQSGRDKIPVVDIPIKLKDFLDRHIPLSAGVYREDKKGVKSDSHGGIIFSEDKKKRELRDILGNMKTVKNITLLIGPEGGFTKQEVHAAVERGFDEVSLGPRILRTETAPITAISIIQYELGDVG